MKSFYLLAALLLCAGLLVGSKVIIDTARTSFEQEQVNRQEDEFDRLLNLRKQCEAMWPLKDVNYIDCVMEVE